MRPWGSILKANEREKGKQPKMKVYAHNGINTEVWLIERLILFTIHTCLDRGLIDHCRLLYMIRSLFDRLLLITIQSISLLR